MTYTPEWQAWDGEGFSGRSHNAITYFSLGLANIEDEKVRRALAQELKNDGVTSTILEGLTRLESATVFHGQVRKSHDEWFPWRGVPSWDDSLEASEEGTWVELGEYE